MKKLMLLSCFLVGISAMSFAQGGGRMRMTPEAQVKQMQDSLKITADQSTKIMAILTAQNAKMDSIRTAGGDRSAMMPVRQAATEKIMAVLTADQKAAYTAMQARMRARMGGGMGGGGGAPPPPTEK